MDTTWRDSLQHILTTRMRTEELTNSTNSTNQDPKDSFSIKMWGGATFDVTTHFLQKRPWERLKTLRDKVR